MDRLNNKKMVWLMEQAVNYLICYAIRPEHAGLERPLGRSPRPISAPNKAVSKTGLDVTCLG